MAEVTVEICHARVGEIFRQELCLESGSTIDDAIRRSDLLRAVPEIDIETCRIGVFGKIKGREAVLRDRDRIEIYRPLIADPKEARRRRAVRRDGKVIA